MASYTHLSFSQTQLKEQIDAIVWEALDETINEMKTWDEYLDTIKKEKIVGDEQGYIIEVEDLRAWIYYYGTGTHMWDNDNPYLSAYMGSDFYNQARPNGKIARWGNRDVTIPNWKTGRGTMTYHGADPAGQVVGTGEGKAPKGNFDNIMQKASDVFTQKVRNKFSKINLEACIISSTVNV